MTTFTPSPRSPLMSMSAAHPAKGPASAPPSTAPETAEHSGHKCTGSCLKALQRGLSSSNHQATRDGKVRCREAWRALATEFPGMSSRLQALACCVGAGAVTALACRDGARLEIAGRSLASQITEAERASSERNARCLSVPRNMRVGHGVPAGVVGITAETSERVRRIKAIGDSNPPVMMEAIGRAIMAAQPSERREETGL